jgi:signal transduction histidine kinase/ActR/RegA family two-component response regulator
MSPIFHDDAEKHSKIISSEELVRLGAARDAAVKAAREAVRDSTRLTRLLSILNDSGDLNLLLDRASATLSELFSADIVVLLDPVGTGTFLPQAGIGLSEELKERPFADHEESSTKRIMSRGEPLLIERAESNPSVDAQLRDMGAECVVGLPVDGSELTRGVLYLARCRPMPFTSDETALLRTMSYRIGRTLIEAQRSSQFEMLLKSGKELSRRIDLPEIAAVAVQMLPRIVHADSAAMILRDVKGELYAAAHSGLDSASVSALCPLALALMNTKPLLNGELYTTSTVNTSEDLPLSAFGVSPMRALLALPIYRDEHLQGVLLCARFSDIGFNAGALQAAVLFGEQVTAAVENAGLYQAVHNELKERKRLEEQQRKWERQQQQIQKVTSLSRLAGAVAHHFNNQLCVVMGSLELAIEDVSWQSEIAAALMDAREAAQKASEVSRSMLTYIGQTVGVRKPLDLSRICRQTLPLLQTATPESLVLKADLPLPGPVVKADGNQIQQVLTQLVTNAWESIDKNNGTIHFSVTDSSSSDISLANRFPVDFEPRDPRYACIEVSDTGCGIADQDIDRLFDPFFSSKFIGRGLGLAVVLGIVKAHGGVITLESKKEMGSTFRVFLPLSEEAVPLPAETADGPLPKVIEGSGVLLVDDDRAVLNVTTVTLQRLGFRVYIALDGVEAVEIFKEHSLEIHAVVCDLSMPRMNGWETVSALRQICSDIPIVLVSGHDESTVSADRLSEEMPMPVFLHKPFSNSELKDALATAMATQPTR